MATKSMYVCADCGADFAKWAGSCGACGAWNTLSEVKKESKKSARFDNYAGETAQVIKLAEVDSAGSEIRSATSFSELDRVLGGGMVAGSVLLIGGDPGIGKSTLLLQVLCYLAQSRKVLYVSGEESARQISLRARRLQLNDKNVMLLTETSVNKIIKATQQEKPQVIVIDSIQTLFCEELSAAPGSVSQVRESAAQLVRLAKQTGIAMFLVGHVTKEGALAGPRILEHMVDTVLYFEGDPGSRFRVIRAIKNRFGAVNELGVFAMTEIGLKEVSNPSAIFLSRHQDEPPPGSIILVTREGTRPMLVELQALVDQSYLSNPRRVSIGLEHNRMAMLLAVLHRHGGVASYDQDVFVNIAGGVRVTETAADLAVIMAIVSSLKNLSLSQDTVVFGEVGLAGEIRPVPAGEERLREAAKHGFKRAIVPQANKPKKPISGIETIGIARVEDALSYV